MKASNKEDEIFEFIVDNGFPVPERQYTAIPNRRYKIDFCWPEYQLCLEVEGGVWTQGRHIQPGGFIKDMEKYNLLSYYGWTLFRVTPSHIRASKKNPLPYLLQVLNMMFPEHARVAPVNAG